MSDCLNVSNYKTLNGAKIKFSFFVFLQDLTVKLFVLAKDGKRRKETKRDKRDEKTKETKGDKKRRNRQIDYRRNRQQVFFFPLIAAREQ